MKSVLFPLSALIFSGFSVAELQPLEDMEDYVIESKKPPVGIELPSLPTAELGSEIHSKKNIPNISDTNLVYIMHRTIKPVDGGVSILLQPTRVVADRF